MNDARDPDYRYDYDNIMILAPCTHILQKKRIERPQYDSLVQPTENGEYATNKRWGAGRSYLEYD